VSGVGDDEALEEEEETLETFGEEETLETFGEEIEDSDELEDDALRLLLREGQGTQLEPLDEFVAKSLHKVFKLYLASPKNKLVSRATGFNDIDELVVKLTCTNSP